MGKSVPRYCCANSGTGSNANESEIRERNGSVVRSGFDGGHAVQGCVIRGASLMWGDWTQFWLKLARLRTQHVQRFLGWILIASGLAALLGYEVGSMKDGPDSSK